MPHSNLPSTWRYGWLFSALPGYRHHSEHLCTYSIFDYAALPPVTAVLDGSYDWLKDDTLKFPSSIGRFYYPDHLIHPDWSPSAHDLLDVPGFIGTDRVGTDVALLIDYLTSLGQWIPPAFQTFMREAALYNRVRSCTDSHLELSVIPAVSLNPSGYLIQFLVDSQGSPRWYLFVNEDQEEWVIAANVGLGFSAEDHRTWAKEKSPEEIDISQVEAVVCSQSFEEFMYRFWLENELWYRLTYEEPIEKPEMQVYLSHYRQY